MRKGTFSGIEVLIVLAVIGFLVVLCIPIFEVTYKVRKYTKFKNSFSGVDRDSLERMDEKNRPLIQGYVNKKMTELAKKYFDAKNGVSWEEVADPSNLEEVNVALIKLKEGEAAESHALDQFNLAKEAARAYKLEVKEKPEDYLK